ncbi:efflux RND transporter permease subunit [Methylorubrum extorquens]|uniref:efflux RND transporter permease subunit n=1 Tax=Methylorubrum extorquens TaxID=408 RepID=UPI000158F9C5|nr:MMPL family transporter [Methylorubrum extorquens]ABY28943.1 putative RND superfamily transporter [Methylorubrum extorquens PA1]KQP94529.1 RND transporter [Methylobacterium sp. Leaf119]WIU40299.1 MMPL family transporter [Methylorubrum extorquens]
MNTHRGRLTGEPVDAGHPAPDRLALGIERLGLIGLRFTGAATLLLLGLCLGAIFGAARLNVDDSLSQLFRADTPEFRQYESLSRRFPSAEFDVLLLVEGDALLARPSLEALRDLVTDVQLVEGTKGVISLFSARRPPEGGHVPPALFPEELPEGAGYDDLIARVRANEILRGKILSEDGRLALVVLALDPRTVDRQRSSEVIGEVRDIARRDLEGSGLTVRLSGVPVMQMEIREAVERDRLLYNGLGFFGGCLIAILFFRRVSFMVVAAAPPLVAILLALGTLGWLDFRLNMFLNMMTPLIMVISFSDSMQLTFAARERLLAGELKREAFRNAVLVVGPACVLTHAAAGLSFGALMFSESDLIRTFGQAGLISTVIALLTVLTLVPLLGILLVRTSTLVSGERRHADTGVDFLRVGCAWIAARMTRRPGIPSLLGLLVVSGLAVAYAHLQPRYRLADQVPDRQHAIAASNRLDAKLTGSNPVDILIEFPPGASLYAPETIAVIGEVHARMEGQPGVGNVWSLETLRRWLDKSGDGMNPGLLRHYAELLPRHLTRRFIPDAGDATVVTGRVPDIDIEHLLPLVDALDKNFGPIRERHPGYGISVTGLSAVAARNSAGMIERLNRSLTVEVAFMAVFVGLAFRSVVVGLACILPGIFPVLAAGTVLWLHGDGLQFAGIVALTVAYGLGLSATIHFLNRLRLVRVPGEHPAAAVERATVLVGPALVVTSVVLTCGLGVTVLSDLPSLRVFGWVSALAMVAALVADFLILRPTITLLGRWEARLGSVLSGRAG